MTAQDANWGAVLFLTLIVAFVLLIRFVRWCYATWHVNRWRHLEDRSLGE